MVHMYYANSYHHKITLTTFSPHPQTLLGFDLSSYCFSITQLLFLRLVTLTARVQSLTVDSVVPLDKTSCHLSA